jgi:glycerol kinase
MVADDLLMQFQADILNRNVIRPLTVQTTALGSAYAAGLAVGYYKDLEELRANWGVDHTWNPQMEDAMRERLYKDWKKAVTRSFDWVS